MQVCEGAEGTAERVVTFGPLVDQDEEQEEGKVGEGGGVRGNLG